LKAVAVAAQCLVAAASHAQTFPQIGDTGIYYDANPGVAGVRFYSDAAGNTEIGLADSGDVTADIVRPCDGDAGAESIDSGTTLPSALSSANFDGFGANIFAPSATSGHCFYRLSNGEFVGIANMDPSGETSPISPTRIWWLPGTAVVTATGFSFAANGGIPAASPASVPAVPLLGLLSLSALLSLLGLRKLKA
jgi:hypothetical protein